MSLYPLLLYILTHEMVHLVRLSTMLTDSERVAILPETEERRVHRIARHILTPTSHPCLHTILQRF